MEVYPTAILAMVDRIADSATDDDDVRTAVEGIRKLKLSGVTPSVVLQQLVIAKPPLNDLVDLHARAAELAQQVSTLMAENAHLEAQVANLHEQLNHLDDRPMIEPVNGFYTMEQFLAVLTSKLRRSYGWRTDYVRASKETPGCNPVANETVQVWQNKNKVPDWAVEQIDRLAFQKRHGVGAPMWSDDDEQFLIKKYNEDPSQSNNNLAKSCSDHFGRPINENSIKGALDRLRKKGHVPKKRPSRNTL